MKMSDACIHIGLQSRSARKRSGRAASTHLLALHVSAKSSPHDFLLASSQLLAGHN
jgi:hypothetical protein